MSSLKNIFYGTITAFLINMFSAANSNAPVKSLSSKGEHWYFGGTGKNLYSSVKYETESSNKYVSKLERKLKNYSLEKREYSREEAIFMYKHYIYYKQEAKKYAQELMDKGIIENKYRRNLIVKGCAFWPLMKYHANRLGLDTEECYELVYQMGRAESCFILSSENPPRIKKGEKCHEEGVFHVLPATKKILDKYVKQKDADYNNSKIKEEKLIILGLYHIKGCLDQVKNEREFYDIYVTGKNHFKGKRYYKKGKRVKLPAHMQNFGQSEKFRYLLPYIEDCIDKILYSYRNRV